MLSADPTWCSPQSPSDLLSFSLLFICSSLDDHLPFNWHARKIHLQISLPIRSFTHTFTWPPIVNFLAFSSNMLWKAPLLILLHKTAYLVTFHLHVPFFILYSIFSKACFPLFVWTLSICVRVNFHEDRNFVQCSMPQALRYVWHLGREQQIFVKLVLQ